MASVLTETFTPSGTPEPTDFMTYNENSKPSQWKYEPTRIKFDPAKHLAIEEPAWRKTLSDFGYDNEKHGISEIGATAAFRLFTEDAVILMRNDLLSGAVQENHTYSSERAPYQTRGFAPSKSRFIYDAWHNQEVLDAISKAAGIDLVPVCDYEIAHTNIQLGANGQEGVKDLSAHPSLPLPEGETLPPSEWDSRPVDDWHFDCFPFVAVLMVSNTTGMTGGETAVMGREGQINTIPGPGMGKVVVMQGSCLKHAALRSTNCSERIAMVTSFRPKDPLVYDMSHLGNIWKCSDKQELGFQWMEYRLKVLEERVRLYRSQLTREWDTPTVEAFSNDLKTYLQQTVDAVCSAS